MEDSLDQEIVVRSAREEVEELGVVLPHTRKSFGIVIDIRNHLLGTDNPEVRKARLENFLALQAKFLSKKVRRRDQPDMTGMVEYIRPRRDSAFKQTFSEKCDNLTFSSFEAMVRWTPKRGFYIDLDQIELVS